MTAPVQGIPPARAASFARLALENVGREYPNKLDHVMNDASEVLAPRALHPVFYGSYDWHSCVHMHWLLARVLHLYPDAPEAAAIAELFDAHFTEEKIAAEVAYLAQPSRTTFERTYGWAWLLKLQTALRALPSVRQEYDRWQQRMQPLADAFVERYLNFLPLARYPIRVGTHPNSAFGLYFALQYAESACDRPLADAVRAKATAWFINDEVYPARYEPGSDDFLSGGLMEAVLMARVLGTGFHAWQARFFPTAVDLQTWLEPVEVSDRTDPKLAHLDGLNLSRAWCWRTLQPHLAGPLREEAGRAAQRHLAAALPHADTGDYAGTHWLASFALLALSEE
ncbi:MAG TPA: DUF2891 domain-containing protein [Noviherbaspirillum sp.]|nr:DUF2891 domain-containing protein [Noviherbaspirillum sp.]